MSSSHWCGVHCALCQNGLNHLDLSGKVYLLERSACGGYSDIWRGILRRDGTMQEVAIKELRIRHSMKSGTAMPTEERLNKRFIREVLLWQKLRHPNVVPLLGLTMDPQNLPTLVSPWYCNGNVIQYLESHRGCNRLGLAIDVANGLSYLHSIPVVHGDIKGENVLIDANGHASLCDFGMSQFLDEACRITGFTTTSAYAGGTDRFLCPELLEDEPKSIATDTWAFGCLVVQILTDQVPYESIMKKHAVPLAVMRGVLPMNNRHHQVEGALWCCLVKCWSRLPEDRPTVSEIHEQLKANQEMIDLLDQDMFKLLSRIGPVQMPESSLTGMTKNAEEIAAAVESDDETILRHTSDGGSAGLAPECYHSTDQKHLTEPPSSGALTTKSTEMALLLEKDFTEGIGESISWLSSILPPISSNSVDYSDVWNRFANLDPKHPLELVGRDSVGSSGFQPFNSIVLNQTFEASGSGPSSRVLGSSLPSAISQDHHVSFDQKRFRDGSSELDSPTWYKRRRMDDATVSQDSVEAISSRALLTRQYI